MKARIPAKERMISDREFENLLRRTSRYLKTLRLHGATPSPITYLPRVSRHRDIA